MTSSFIMAQICINKYFDGDNAAGYTDMGWPCPHVDGNA